MSCDRGHTRQFFAWLLGVADITYTNISREGKPMMKSCMVSLCIFLLTLSAMAQIQNGQFTGTVTDSTGAALAGAKVTVTNQATNLSVTTTTNGTGEYSAKELPVGVYKITVEAGGFKTFTDSKVNLDAGSIARVDAQMRLGQAREVVEVTGEAATVQTEDTKLLTTVGSAQIANLPMNGRNVFDLMQISAGAVNVAGTDFENGHGTVVNGVREDFNGFLINGVSNKGMSGGAVNVPIQDSVEEFQQLQLNMSAQYGNSAGGSVNLVTKSGTNAWHGSAWEYVRNNDLDANDFFLNQQGQKAPPLHFNQFGVTLGGPIVRDKLFFFLSLQGDRFISSGTPITTTQETQAWRDAVVQADTNAGLNSTATLLYKTFAPSIQGVGDNGLTADVYTGGNYAFFLCQSNNFGGTGLMAQKWASIFGVTAQDQ